MESKNCINQYTHHLETAGLITVYLEVAVWHTLQSNDVTTNAIDDMMANKVLLKAENNNNRAIKLLYTPQKVFINADKGRISQVILNLLDNAVKFTRDSGGTITIILEKKEDEFNNNPQHVIINIKDTGKGIDPDYLQNLLQNQTLVRGLGCSYVKAL